ncbi:hypothetical protein LEM8419_00284 [Neolewinella maritima]|uniref:M23ase beta-sheet core domain-containing protein n=1 Tax=Neolewinella maritima TaxID=1383882 RepID=A0ABN8EYV0_9BACT|nr:M23 family metallopeptidase [Neolewinella maritima]CAH0998991.1 hypothetical protein LEM8419_00284 [Neolewinella maritima]
MEEPQKTNRWKRLREKSRDEYQLVVRNLQNYDEVGSYTLTPLNVYILFSGVFVIMAFLVVLLLAFTPLRRYIPGYGDVVQQQELTELEGALTELSDLVESQQTYIENLKRTVLGEVTTVDSLAEREVVVPREVIAALPPSEAEIKLRRELEQERQGRVGTTQSAAAPPSPGSDAVSLAQVYLVTPVNGEISAGFDPASAHTGVDILAPQHTAIKAVRAGIVFMSEFTSANGNVIGIQHDHNLISFYKHNEQLLKEVGDRVQQSEAIAIIGNTGTQSTGPHLHFELWYDGRAVDPRDYLSF